MSEQASYLTTTEFARRVRASANAVKLWCAAGKLHDCIKTPGGHWRIPASNLAALGIGRAHAVMETAPTYAAAPSAAAMRHSINAKKAEIANFCRRNHIHELALFGSILGDDFRSDSDIDVLVEFEPGAVVGLITLAGMEIELSELLGRKVDLRAPGDLSRYFRDEVVASAEVIYER